MQPAHLRLDKCSEVRDSIAAQLAREQGRVEPTPEDVTDAEKLAAATYTCMTSLGDPLALVMQELPVVITMLSNPTKYLNTAPARRKTPSLLEKARTIHLGILQELNLHGAPLAPGEAKAAGLKIHYTRILKCPKCGSKTRLELVEDEEEILVVQECQNCSYKYITRIPKPQAVQRAGFLSQY